MSKTAEREELTRRYGKEIFARLEGTGPLPFSPAWWDDRLMDMSMGDEAVKLQLFRFVDVLPQLHSPSDVTRHLREYFAAAGHHVPGWIRLALRLLPSRGLLGRLLAGAARVSARRLARKFIAGSNVQEAASAIRRLRRRSLAFTVDLLGEATITEKEADESRDQYLELIHGLSREVDAWPANVLIDRDDRGPLPRVNVSVKLSALNSQFDAIDPDGAVRAVGERLRPILRAARERRVFVNIDMEQHAVKDLTYHIFRRVLEEPEFRDWTDVGLAVQAYLRDTRADLLRLRKWARHRGVPVWVRLVKGAYWDYETILSGQFGWPTPVWSHKPITDASYEGLTNFLLNNRRWLRPAFGSHNIRSLAHALATADLLDVPPTGLELQMLYGMAEPVKDVLVALGRRVRVYTPYGELLPGMAYLVRRLLENTANESFLRASFTEHTPIDRLLANPLEKAINGMREDQRKLTLPPIGLPPTAATNSGSSLSSAQTAFRIEPLTDFSRSDARQVMTAALEQVGRQFDRTYPLVIAGCKESAQKTIDSFNPSHCKQIVGRCAAATTEQARRAVEAAAAAFPKWRDTDPAKRAQYLFDAARVMRRRRFELAAWQVYECGKPWREADADVAESIDYCDFYGREMLRLAAPQRRDAPGEENVYFYEPRGVAVVVAPWNFPMAILCGMTAAALVTGNTAVMKPAEQSCVVGAKLMEVFEEVGLPPGVVNFLPGVGEEIGPTLVEHPAVAVIAFTGSRNVGLHINRDAAEPRPGQDHVKRVIAEMGGKNAIVVDDDADLDEAVHGVVASAFGYAGQKCSACSRVIVPSGLHDSLLTRIVEATRSLKVAPAEDPGCTIGPVIDDQAQARILRTIEQGKSQGRLVYAGELGTLAQEGCFVAPCIFADVAPSAPLASEEIFGPVLTVLRSESFEQSLEIANSTAYALTGGLYSRSPEHIEQAKRRFRVGNLYINRKITGALVDRQPFGGFKMSGIGSKAGGPDYLLQFVQPRTITENTLRRGFAPNSPAGPTQV
ncbi:MAG TPA: L-glutamate gamma-semialdehyde dehydrogenase [Gemmataceae bacterium]|nr:L-glutamate gamma-semialdehyde dehydrogenase [Gemmataceae bacterium]